MKKSSIEDLIHSSVMECFDLHNNTAPDDDTYGWNEEADDKESFKELVELTKEAIEYTKKQT